MLYVEGPRIIHPKKVSLSPLSLLEFGFEEIEYGRLLSLSVETKYVFNKRSL